MKKKAVFFDIDGTLWDEKMHIEESTKEAIRKLKENGHLAFLCSGRSRSSIQAQHLLELGFDGIIAACGNYVEMNGEVIYDNVMTTETANWVAKTLADCRLPSVLEGPYDCWIDTEGFEEDPYVDYLFALLGENAHPIRNSQKDFLIEKCSFDNFPYSEYAKAKEILGEKFDFIEHSSERDFHVVEMIPKGTSKATGIEWVRKYLGLAHDDIYAVGDSVNDLDMLKYVSHSIAMGNGVDAIKEICEYVTKRINEGGIYHAMEYYGLI